MNFERIAIEQIAYQVGEVRGPECLVDIERTIRSMNGSFRITTNEGPGDSHTLYEGVELTDHQLDLCIRLAHEVREWSLGDDRGVTGTSPTLSGVRKAWKE